MERCSQTVHVQRRYTDRSSVQDFRYQRSKQKEDTSQQRSQTRQRHSETTPAESSGLWSRVRQKHEDALRRLGGHQNDHLSEYAQNHQTSSILRGKVPAEGSAERGTGSARRVRGPQLPGRLQLDATTAGCASFDAEGDRRQGLLRLQKAETRDLL